MLNAVHYYALNIAPSVELVIQFVKIPALHFFSSLTSTGKWRNFYFSLAQSFKNPEKIRGSQKFGC